MSSPEDRKSSGKEPRMTRAAAAAAAMQTLEGTESDDNNSRFEHLETTVKALQAQGGALTDEISELKGLIKGLTFQLKALTPPSNQDAEIESGQSKPPTETDAASFDLQGVIQKGLASELTKKALSFPESARLQGISNYEQWFQALKILFRAYNLENLLVNTDGFNQQNSQIQAMLLLLIRESLSLQIASSITWINAPEKALCYIRDQYSQREDAICHGTFLDTR